MLSFGSPELFMLAILGVSLAAVLSRGNVVKGLTAGFLGLLLGLVGTFPTTAEERFSFGSLFLSDGFALAAVALGVFGLAAGTWLAHGQAVATDEVASRWPDIAARVEVERGERPGPPGGRRGVGRPGRGCHWGTAVRPSRAIRARTAVGKLVFGSAAQRILLDATCPVLAVKPAVTGT